MVVVEEWTKHLWGTLGWYVGAKYLPRDCRKGLLFWTCLWANLYIGLSSFCLERHSCHVPFPMTEGTWWTLLMLLFKVICSVTACLQSYWFVAERYKAVYVIIALFLWLSGICNLLGNFKCLCYQEVYFFLLFYAYLFYIYVFMIITVSICSYIFCIFRMNRCLVR